MQPPIVKGLTETSRKPAGMMSLLMSHDQRRRARPARRDERRTPPDTGPKIGPIVGPPVKTPI